MIFMYLKRSVLINIICIFILFFFKSVIVRYEDRLLLKFVFGELISDYLFYVIMFLSFVEFKLVIIFM